MITNLTLNSGCFKGHISPSMLKTSSLIWSSVSGLLGLVSFTWNSDMTTDYKPDVELWLFQRTYFPINVNDKFSHMIISIRITGISQLYVYDY